MRIYTGRGDDGATDLHDGSRVSKASARIEAVGTVDELNARLGVIRPTGQDDLDEYLQSIQQHLHVLQAELGNPEAAEDDPTITEAHVELLEGWIDDAQEDLDPLTSFVLPGGSQTGASLHHARAVCRRAERRAVTAAATTSFQGDVVVYLNRLSDALFVFARLANRRDGVEEEAPTY